MTRTWFRRRLASDPRRWVLLLAGLEGLGGFALNSPDRLLGAEYGAGAAIWLFFAALAPSTGVLLMLVHGRVLWWTGKLLGGRAAPREIHAAFAWAALPLVLASAPLALLIPLRAAARLLDPVPAVVQAGADLARAVEGPVTAVAVLASLASAVLYVRFLAEAQGFGAWRALANQLLAVLAGITLLLVPVLANEALPADAPVRLRLLAGVASGGVLVAAAEWAVRAAARRAVRAAVPVAGPLTGPIRPG